MFAAAAATLALMGAADDPGYAFARSLALAGPRPAAGAAERSAHRRVAAAFADAGLVVTRDRFRVPGHGRSRNVTGALARPGSCLWILMAHADTVPPSPGAEDNASGVGTLVALAPRVAALQPRCDVWLVATGAEERIYTGRPDHLGAGALVRPRARPRAGQPTCAGRSRSTRSGAAGRCGCARRRGGGSSAACSLRPRGSGVAVRWVADEDSGNSDHREFGLAGLTAAKLGVPGNPLRHTAADRAGRLQETTFPRVRKLLEALLQTG